MKSRSVFSSPLLYSSGLRGRSLCLCDHSIVPSPPSSGGGSTNQAPPPSWAGFSATGAMSIRLIMVFCHAPFGSFPFCFWPRLPVLVGIFCRFSSDAIPRMLIPCCRKFFTNLRTSCSAGFGDRWNMVFAVPSARVFSQGSPRWNP